MMVHVMHDDRLPVGLAAVVIAGLSLLCWAVVWAIVAAIGAML